MSECRYIWITDILNPQALTPETLKPQAPPTPKVPKALEAEAFGFDGDREWLRSVRSERFPGDWLPERLRELAPPKHALYLYDNIFE